MTATKRDLAIYIGRFQPPCNHHLETIRHGLDIADNVLIFVGSANAPRTPKNPFTAAERADMISSCLSEEERKRVIFSPKEDSLYDDNQWVAGIEHNVKRVLRLTGGYQRNDTILIGSQSDNSSWYLDKFPHWQKDFLPVKTGTSGDAVHATDVRNAMYAGGTWCFDEVVRHHVPTPVADWLSKFRESDTFKSLQEEDTIVKKYIKAWEVAPYPPTFTTVDAVVVQSSNVLLVRRGDSPGRGLWALPGGFLNQKERILDGMLRELKEETLIRVPPAVLRNSIKKTEVFDHPDRSLRGRTITHAFLIELQEPYGMLPPVKGADDADDADWFPFSELIHMRSQLFEDHWDIIYHMVGGFMASNAQPIILGNNNLNRED